MFRQASAPRPYYSYIFNFYNKYLKYLSSQGFLIRGAEAALPTVFGKYDNS